MKRSVSHQHQTGFTLVEMFATLMISSVLITGVIPGVIKLIASNRITTEINSLTSYLHLARSEAIKQHHRAVLCSSADGRRCLGSKDWGQGYMVFIDRDADRMRDSDETVIHFRALNTNKIRLDAGLRKTVAYQPTGWAPGSNLTFTVCDPGNWVSPRAVVVSSTGRPRVADIHPNGSKLTCS